MLKLHHCHVTLTRVNLTELKETFDNEIKH